MPPRDTSITHERVVNFLRGKGYSYRKQQDRTVLYRNGLSRVSVPRTTTISEDWVRAQFKFIGATTDEINAFIAACKS